MGPAHRGISRSAGRRSVSGMRAWPSLMGLRPACTATSNRTSRSWLCLEIRSPPVAQQRAWSPRMSLCLEQAGQGPAVLNTGIPSLNFTAVLNSAGCRWSPRARIGGQLSQDPECGRVSNISLATSRSPEFSLVWVKRRVWLARSILADICCWLKPWSQGWVTNSCSLILVVRVARMLGVRTASSWSAWMFSMVLTMSWEDWKELA